MFISYSQNFEDVLLNRVFADKEKGCYIDVGAQHPLYDSVTKAFYDRGWQGINIEPVKEYYELLAQERTRDLNLNLAVGETESELDFFELEGTGLSTFDHETASRLAQEGNYKINSYHVPVVKLATICEEHLNCPIDFLKIDVEGWEEKVILGNDWAHFRPTVILLEATIPNSPTRAETNIHDILQGQNYQKVYFDGLNDYYLANESSELIRHFATPPNVFDKFITYHLSTARSHAKNLEEIIKSREAENTNIQQQLEQQQQTLTTTQQQLEQQQQTLTTTQQQLSESERYNHIFNNRLKDEKFEVQRLIKVDIQLNQEITQLQTKLAQQNQKLQESEHKNNILNNQIHDENFGTKKVTELNQEITQLQNQLTERNQELIDANQLIAAMKTSKFWKMRTVWFGVKNSLGIPNKG